MSAAEHPSHRPVVTVGTDGSPASIEALRWAGLDAQLRGAELRVVTAWPRELAGGWPLWTGEQVREASQQMLDDAIRAAGLPKSVSVERLALQGAPAQMLAAAASDSVVLVVGARGQGGFARMLLGSVSSRCVQQATGPVVVVRNPTPATATRLPVVCGVDGSSASLDALNFAANEARARRVSLVAVHTVYWDLAGFDLIRPDAGQLREWGRGLLTEAVTRALGPPEARQGLDVELAVVDGHPAGVLEQRAAESALLVVGTHGRSALGSALLGSVSGHCVRHAPCPVAVVPGAA